MYDSKKPVIMIIGRQHSGETHSSFIIHGLINTLCSQNHAANKMRNLYEWWVLPMVNPDGIVAGNYRTNCQGKDMNRHFYSDDDPMADKEGRCSEVETMRDYMKNNLGKDQLKMFIDIHAHSIQTSIFSYAPLPDEEENEMITQKFA
jgi:murein tripeptide amidase MpaA